MIIWPSAMTHARSARAEQSRPQHYECLVVRARDTVCCDVLPVPVLVVVPAGAVTEAVVEVVPTVAAECR